MTRNAISGKQYILRKGNNMEPMFATTQHVTVYLVDQLVQIGMAFGIALVVLFGLWSGWARKVGIQKIVMPFYDELSDIAIKWRAGEPISPTEGYLAVAFAIVTAAVAYGVLMLISHIATPHG